MLDGIAAWQAHPWRRNPAPVPVLWRDGSTALSAYAGDGVPVLVVPSLINRAYVLDLTPDRSFLRGLAALGLRPFLLDWGGPGTVEQGFDLDAYVQRRLLPALSIIEAITGQRAAMLGYCMGGTLAAAAAARLPGRVARLCTVGAPWDFGADTGSLAGRVRALMAAGGASQPALALRNVADAFGLVPCDLFQLLFALVNPVQALVKFRRFAALDPDSDEARHFVALEDWLADGVDMAGPAAIDLLVRWQIDNALASGRFSLLGGRVQARDIRCPALVVAGRVDRIAPPAGALALADAIPGARRLEPPLGHVGMIVGRDSGALVAAPVAAFLRGEG
jgi:polyhydroxyalkanoate synthase